MKAEPWPDELITAIQKRIVRCRCVTSCNCCWNWSSEYMDFLIPGGSGRLVNVRFVLLNSRRRWTCGNARCVRIKHAEKKDLNGGIAIKPETRENLSRMLDCIFDREDQKKR